MKRNRNGVALSGDRRAFNFLAYFSIILLTVICLLPFWLVVIGSFTSEAEIYARGYSMWPHEFSLEAYRLAFKYPDQVFRAYGITVSITALGTFVSLLMTSMCGYALQRDDFRSRNFFTMFVFFTMLFNGGLVPWYLLITNYLKLKDTYWVMILTLLVNVYFIILMKNFMKTVPKALIEAAKIDGAGEVYTFFKIVMPIMAPVLASIGFMCAVGHWNEWQTSMLYIDDADKATLQLMLMRVEKNIEFLKMRESMGNLSEVELKELNSIPTMATRMALLFCTLGPILVIYPFFQKFFIRGMTIGSVKG